MVSVHLLLAILALDDQLTTTGHHLRHEWAQTSTGADLLRDRGVTCSSTVTAIADLIPVDQHASGSPAPREDDGVDKAFTRARLLSNERKDPSAGTTHLLTVLLADPDDRCDSLLAAVGVDTEEVRRTLGHP